MSVRYDQPHRAARAANALIRWLAEFGISIAGTRALRVRGRKRSLCAACGIDRQAGGEHDPGD